MRTSEAVTRTYNPLPFHELEPKRFEDLVRQLVYDFKPWRRLEATGRSGSDDGFDARGLEIIDSGDVLAEPDASAENEDEEPLQTANDRLWLIQCKREKAIGPSKLKKYLAEIRLAPEEKLYGIIFAAACDFSKTSRDAFFSWCRTLGIAEAHIWGKGELEDMLYQPKNDNLLFAYFGISLSIRRRAFGTQLRAEIAMKRKLKKIVLSSSADILVRDPSATDYPDVAHGKRPTHWWVYRPEELSHLGLMLSIRWHYAYIDQSTGEWDVADAVSFRKSFHQWQVDDLELNKLEDTARALWDSLPNDKRGWLQVSGFIPLRNIIAIDELGDELFEGTHLYAPFTALRGPFEGGYSVRLTTTSTYSESWNPDAIKRVVRFPAKVRMATHVDGKVQLAGLTEIKRS